uniref:Uncharacterized protein n=2 Tax=Meloidogyne incognita group TaxID=654580 RepID=A0A915LMR8_MELJA
MPIYEFTIYFRPMVKDLLAESIKKSALCLLNQGGVIMNMQSLGYRDLPMRALTKRTKEIVYTTNSMLFNVSLPKNLKLPTIELLRQDPDLLRVCAVDTKDFQEPPESCDLEAMLKPPAYRQSVEKLRLNKQMSFVGAFKIYKKTEAEYRNIPKSYFIPLSRR